MTCALEPTRICGCCELGKSCAFELQLSLSDQSALARVLAIAGENPRYRPAREPKVAPRAVREAVEPVAQLECSDCGRTTEMLAYLAAFLKDNHVRLPPCPVCVADRIAA